MKAKILLLLLPFATLAMAQTDNSARVAQELVISVSDNVELSTAQTSQLSLAATQFQMQLLQKIEELTLYIIQQDKRIEELESVIKQGTQRK